MSSSKAIKTVRVAFSEAHALELLFPAKGHAAKIERFFSAVAPLLSTWLVTGGNKADFEVTATTRHGALVAKLWHAHTEGKGTAAKIGHAWAIVAARALTFKGKSCEYSQEDHDNTLDALAVEFSGLFPEAAKKEKTASETPTQKVQRLESELAALVIERDAALSALKALQAATVKPAPAMA